MTRNFSLLQAVLLSIGVFLLAVAGSDLYHWYETGNLWYPSKYSLGFYTTYGQAPGMFVAALVKNLLLTVGAIVIILGGFILPSQLRRRQQAHLAAIKPPSPPYPWPSRPKGPNLDRQR